MKGFLIGVGVVVAAIVLAIWGIVGFVLDRSSQVVSNVTDPAVMQQNYESLHSDCSNVRKDWLTWQTDLTAANNYQSQNAPILTGTTKVSALQASNVQTQMNYLQTLAQGDQQQLQTDASSYDTTVETETKNIGSKWIEIMFHDTGLPQSIQPPFSNVDCGSGVWPAAA